MCTLTYIPVDEGFIFTHNRDESNTRPTSKTFHTRQSQNHTLYYPEDLEAHGSWIGFAENNTTACLLNGGSKKYSRKLPYRKSRGLVVLESFDYDHPERFYQEYDFHKIEPFTLLIKHLSGLYQITHDEDETCLTEHPTEKPHIWSSTTLYSKEVRAKRRKWFEDWLAPSPDFTPANIQAFHNSAGDGDTENDLVMSRWGILQTLSITQIASINGEALLTYRDFIHQSVDRVEVPLG